MKLAAIIVPDARTKTIVSVRPVASLASGIESKNQSPPPAKEQREHEQSQEDEQQEFGEESETIYKTAES
jgi:hypothetical protein